MSEEERVRRGNEASRRYRERKRGIFNEDTKLQNVRIFTDEERVTRNNQASQRRRDRDKDRINARNRVRYAERPEHFRELSRAWVDKNRESHNALGRKWYEENKYACHRRSEIKRATPEYKEYQRKKYLQNKDAICHRSKVWAEKNPERAKENTRAWYRENKEKMISLATEWSKRNPEKRKVNIENNYIKTFLGVKNPPKELIEAKRVQLRITRALREMVKTPAN
tara:strand:- start:84 stop:758 length:675 start_codon:yes stop_codon:yes gene_type:complete